ncbi:sodium-dependent transporter [Helicobacter himalayensis]|uniref:sodium-dependent transporter n=1 Tax=Helicobacter himalayensis TaxID=1591088 RepID=UPI003D6FD3AF
MYFSKIGFILAALGSSIGLGHIWKFPYTAGLNGGGAFVVLYVLLAFGIGVALLLTEMILGQASRKNALECYPTLYARSSNTPPLKKFRLFGFSVVVGPLILSFYAVILGWIMCYLMLAFMGYPSSVEEAKVLFSDLSEHSFWYQSFGFSAILFFSAFIVAAGIKEGIERFNIIFMPLLFVIFIGLLIYAMSMSGFGKSVDFMFKFDFSKITSRVVIEALGQVFFSLSLGVGTILTYARYASQSQNLLKSSLWIVLSGIVISLIAGLMIFTFLYEFGQEPKGGQELLFEALPLAFGKMNATIPHSGEVVGFLFFLAVIFAGITSAVSILEPSAAAFKDRFNLSQAKSVWIITLGIWIVGEIIIVSCLSAFAPSFRLFNHSLFENIAFVSSDFLMPLGGLLAVIFVGYRLKTKFLQEITGSFLGKWQFRVWIFLVRFVAPIAIVGILVWEVSSVLKIF